ncbi:hypothetical protein G6F56_013462 [Rhizopus delemar]|nr:hypothetical protein G6F56_013462 [Rhizopus delemar]
MMDLGIKEIKSDYGSLPCCWGGYIGKLVYENLLAAFRHIGPSLYPFLGLDDEFDEERYDELLDKAFDECAQYQTFINVRWAIGKKVVSSAL